MTTILTKKKDTAGAPAPGDLTNSAGGAELAVNTATKRLYTKDSGGTVVEIGTNPSTIDTTTVDTTNLEVTNIKAKDGTAAMQIADSTGVVSVTANPILSGGTANGVTYLNGSKVLTSGSALTFDGTVLASTTVDATNVEVTNIKAKDGTASISLADTTGIATFSKATVVSTTDNTNAALRITQLGTGNALLVEDSANPDSTPFVIDASGKVNVGSSTWYLAPALSAVVPPKIQFNGAAGTDASLALNSWQTGTNVDANLLFNRGDTSIIGDFSGAVDSGDALGSIKWSGSDGTEFIQGASIQAYVDGTAGTGDMPGRLVFSTTADGASSPTERMRIDSSGNVGIGTSSPASGVRLQVGGGKVRLDHNTALEWGGAAYSIVGNATTGFLQFNTASTERARIDSSGNVGIGTSSPARRLTVFSPTSADNARLHNAQFSRLEIMSDRTGATDFVGGVCFLDNTAAAVSQIASQRDGVISFQQGAVFTERMRIDSSGNVGIGTSSPGAKLDVNGGALIQGLTVGRGAGAVATNTAVGASALAANTSGTINTAIGYQAGFSNATGGASTFVGYRAGYTGTDLDNVTAIGREALYLTTGDYNTAVGAQALYSNTTASNNTAVGYQAGYANTTGEANNYVGYQAGYSNATSTTNNAFGNAALYFNTGGSDNVAIGHVALYQNTTGSFNSALGKGALQNNTTASNNTAVGYQAGYANTTGTRNTFVGTSAGAAFTTGSNNAAFGSFAMQGTTSTNNTAIGDFALQQLTTGGFNTAIGNGSGYLITTGAKNTIVGLYNGNQGGLDIRTASNYIVLSDGDGNPRGIFDGSGNWLVNTTSSSGAGASSGKAVINFDGTVINGLYVSDTRTSAGANNALIFGRGATYVGKIETTLSATNYISASDYRLKNVTGSLTGYKERVMSLQPKQGTWIVDGSEFRGFLAHDFAGSYPKSVSGEKDAVDANGKPMMQGIQASTSEVVADLVALIQEQQAIIESLKTRLDAANL